MTSKNTQLARPPKAPGKMSRRGRVFPTLVGEDLPQSKLTEAKVRSMRRLHARKEALIKRLNEVYSAKAFAKRYQVHQCTVEKVLSYESWRHVL